MGMKNNILNLWVDERALGGFIQSLMLIVGRTIIGQTGIVGLIGSWFGA